MRAYFGDVVAACGAGTGPDQCPRIGNHDRKWLRRSFENFEKGLDVTDFVRTKKSVHNAPAIAVELFDLRPRDRRGRAGGGFSRLFRAELGNTPQQFSEKLRLRNGCTRRHVTGKS